MDLADIHTESHPKAADEISNADEIFSRIDHILGHKVNLANFKNIEIISIILSNYNAMRLEINCKKKL